MKQKEEAGQQLKQLYATRFESSQLAGKNAIWRTLCRHFFAKRINANWKIADIACGYCEFINNITAAEKYAVDLNPDTKNFVGKDVKFVNGTLADLAQTIVENYLDAIFISNFLEHLDSKDEIFQLFAEAKKLLKPNGKILILQPNIKYVKGAYWDFFDHKTPLTDQALIELATMLNMNVEECIPKFLPYTTKSKVPQSPWLIWAYLKLMPISGWFLGSQSFLIFSNR